MLETDCLIPTKPVQIEHPEHYTLYGNARAVKSLMDDGLGKWAIIKKLRLSEDAYTEAVFDIRKQNGIEEMNGRKPERKRTMKEKVRELKEKGMRNSEIARELNISAGRVSQIVKSLGLSQINKEFDDAVNDMIAESKAQFNEDFEDTITEAPEEIEQAAEPTTVTEEHTAEPIPDAVMQAVIDKIVKLSDTLSDNLLTVKKIQQENEQIRSELAVLYGWRAEHEGAEN